jgi:branched-chain amino acid transport system substrate-binding protein
VSAGFCQALLRRYVARFPGAAMFTGGSACSGLYRGIKLWEAAVREAGTLAQDDVVRALDHAAIAEGPGGPAQMVTGQHHLRLNMYIAQAAQGRFRIVENLGAIEPQEGQVPSAEAPRARAAV